MATLYVLLFSISSNSETSSVVPSSPEIPPSPSSVVSPEPEIPPSPVVVPVVPDEPSFVSCTGGESSEAVILISSSSTKDKKSPYLSANSYISNSEHPTRNDSITLSAVWSATFFNSLSTIRLSIDEWSTTILNDSDPILSVLLYVYIGSVLPRKLVGLHCVEFVSLILISYGGNHITLPPFGPFSDIGSESISGAPLQAKFSIENIYFLTFLLSTVSSILPPSDGAILRLNVFVNTESLLPLKRPPLFCRFLNL